MSVSAERHPELDSLAPAADTVTVTNMLIPADEKRTARALSRRGAVETPKAEEVLSSQRKRYIYVLPVRAQTVYQPLSQSVRGQSVYLFV